MCGLRDQGSEMGRFDADLSHMTGPVLGGGRGHSVGVAFRLRKPNSEHTRRRAKQASQSQYSNVGSSQKAGHLGEWQGRSAPHLEWLMGYTSRTSPPRRCSAVGGGNCGERRGRNSEFAVHAHSASLFVPPSPNGREEEARGRLPTSSMPNP